MSEPIEPMPLVAPLRKPPKLQPEQIKAKESAPTGAPIDEPQLETTVVPIDKTDLSFPGPVEGIPKITTETPLPTPHPPKPTGPTKFDPNATEGGFYPKPLYPPVAERNRQQGTVVLEFTVDASGAVTSVKVQKTSGFNVLDEAAMKTVKERWRFPPGGPRYYFNKFTFKF